MVVLGGADVDVDKGVTVDGSSADSRSRLAEQATRIQCAWRMIRAFGLSAAQRKKRAEELQALIEAENDTLRVNGRRVQAWSEESARLAMAELNGRIGERGMVIWPKGTVEKLLIERSKYSDVILKHKRREAAAKRAADQASERASQAVREVQQAVNTKQKHQDNKADATGPWNWKVSDWVNSLDVSALLSDFITARLREHADDPRFERAFVAKLGQGKPKDGASIIQGLLEPNGEDRTSFLGFMTQRLAASAVEITKEVNSCNKPESAATRPRLSSKFFDVTSKFQDKPESKPITLTYGDKRDFYAGLDTLIGKASTDGLFESMRKDHLEGPDATVPFTAPNYGTTTRSDVEFLFVLEPSKDSLAKLKISAWPIEKKLAEDPKSKHLCRQLRYPKFFTEARQDISKRLRPLNLEFNGEMFLGARLYTGPMVRGGCSFHLTLASTLMLTLTLTLISNLPSSVCQVQHNPPRIAWQDAILYQPDGDTLPWQQVHSHVARYQHRIVHTCGIVTMSARVPGSVRSCAPRDLQLAR